MFSISDRLLGRRLRLGRWVLAGALCLPLQDCANAYRDFGNKSSDPYRISQAKHSMDELDFDNAIAAISPVLISQPKNPEVVYLASAAHAGRAGLKILDLLTSIPTQLKNKGLLEIFAENMHDMTAAKIDDIETAVSVIQNFSDKASERSPDLNFYALFLYYARIGAIINLHAYDSSETLIPTFSACNTTATDGLTDPEIDTIMITLPRIIDTAGGVAGGGSGLDSVLATDLNSLLGSSLPSTAIPCSSASGADHLLCVAVRVLVNKGHANGGIGIDSPGNVPGQEPGGVCVP